jgi:quercetin dioxygenase-like cupin family protein
VPWGEHGDAKAKVLAGADGYTIAVIEAKAGYAGTPHEHTHTEFLYVLEGEITNQGATLEPGDGYVAEAGSQHTEFIARTDVRYVSIFKL